MTTNYQTGTQSGNDIKEKLKQDVGNLKHEVEDKAREASRNLADKGKEKAEALSSKAADTLDNVEAAAEAQADALQDVGWDNLSEYVREMAHGIGGLSDNLRNKSVDELVRSASDLARRNTGLFVLGAVAIGFGLSRFAKAAPRTDERGMRADADAYGYPGSENSSTFDGGSHDYEPFSPAASDQYKPYDQSGTSDTNRPFDRH